MLNQVESYKEKINLEQLPEHIAIIMDGNGRWAMERGFERVVGHQNGVISVREVTEAATRLGIKYLTLYTFSTENWGRPQAEVDALMVILVDSIEKETPTLHRNNIRLQVIGDMGRMPQKVREKLQGCIDHTSKNTGLTLVLALSYSARWEIVNMAKVVAQKVQNGELSVDAIDEKIISDHLTTKDIPDPDLLIRTSGELRISNFLLWQLAYSEFYFAEVCWPDFRSEEFYKAVFEYQQRNRRYGKL